PFALQQVSPIERGRCHPHPDLAQARLGLRPVLNLQDFGTTRSSNDYGFHRAKGGSTTEDYLLGAVGGAARGCELFTEDYLLGAVSGAARGCEPFHGRLPAGAVSGAAGSCGRRRVRLR